jgi:hypothetical protein
MQRGGGGPPGGGASPAGEGHPSVRVSPQKAPRVGSGLPYQSSIKRAAMEMP